MAEDDDDDDTAGDAPAGLACIMYQQDDMPSCGRTSFDGDDDDDDDDDDDETSFPGRPMPVTVASEEKQDEKIRMKLAKGWQVLVWE